MAYQDSCVLHGVALHSSRSPRHIQYWHWSLIPHLLSVGQSQDLGFISKYASIALHIPSSCYSITLGHDSLTLWIASYQVFSVWYADCISYAATVRLSLSDSVIISPGKLFIQYLLVWVKIDWRAFSIPRCHLLYPPVSLNIFATCLSLSRVLGFKAFGIVAGTVIVGIGFAVVSIITVCQGHGNG